MDFTSACVDIKRHQQSVADDRYLSNPHARVHRVFTGSAAKFQHWQRDWNRDQCTMVAQLRAGHSPLLAGYLHRIGRRDSATCPHCNGADETAEHLVLRCPAHEQARRDIWLGGLFNTDPRRLWEFLEWIGAVTRPPTGNEREREREAINSHARWHFQRCGTGRTCLVPSLPLSLRLAEPATGQTLLQGCEHPSADNKHTSQPGLAGFCRTGLNDLRQKQVSASFCQCKFSTEF